MGYRDEQEALRAKVRDLEGKLDDAEGEIARLRGEGVDAPVVEAHSEVLDRPLRQSMSRELPFEVSTEGYEAIAELLRRRIRASPTQVGRQLNAHPFKLSYDKGVTRIECTLDWKSLSNSVFAGSGLVGGLGSLMSLGVLIDVFHAPEHMLWIVPTLLVGSGFAFRRRAQKRLDRAAKTYLGTFEAVCELAEQHAVREEPAVKVRVEAAEEQVEALEAAVEAMAPEEAARVS